MKQWLYWPVLLVLGGCATTAGPRLMIDSPAPGWEQVIAIPPPVGPDGFPPLMVLRHRMTGAEITVDAYKFGLMPVREVAGLVRNKLRFGQVMCTPIEDDGRIAGFRTTLFGVDHQLWHGKIAVLRLPGAPESTVFVFAGRWRAQDDLWIARDFDEIVNGAAVR